MLTTDWYREHIPAFRAAFQDGDILLPKDAEVLDDLRAFKLEKGIAKIPESARTREGGDRKKQRHGDAGIGLALAHYASRQEAMVYEYHRVNLRAASPGTPGAGLGASRPLRIKAGFGLGKGAW